MIKKSSKKVDTKSPTIFITNKIFWILNKRELPWCSGVWIYQDIDPYMDIPDDYQLLRSSTACGLCILQFLSIMFNIRPYHRISCPSGPAVSPYPIWSPFQGDSQRLKFLDDIDLSDIFDRRRGHIVKPTWVSGVGYNW